MVKQYPGVFDYKKQRGESKDNFESRMKETGGKANWTPSDGKAAILRAKERERLQEQQREQSNRQMQRQQLADLHRASIEQRQFRHAAVRSAKLAQQRQDLSKALDDWMAMKFPPPPPEPTIVVVQEDDGAADLGSRNFDVAKWAKKPRSWWC
jgi:hypothetical protein